MPLTIDALSPRLRAKFVVDGSGCWLWQAALDTYGYGQVWYGGHMKRAHRVVYGQLIGPIPDGLQIDHLCRVRRCVNPQHMEPVPQRVNILRGTAPSATCATKTHCVNGHRFDDTNTYRKSGRRECRECHREQNRKWSQTTRKALTHE